MTTALCEHPTESDGSTGATDAISGRVVLLRQTGILGVVHSLHDAKLFDDKQSLTNIRIRGATPF